MFKYDSQLPPYNLNIHSNMSRQHPPSTAIQKSEQCVYIFDIIKDDSGQIKMVSNVQLWLMQQIEEQEHT